MLLHLPGDHTAGTVSDAMITLPEQLRRSLTWNQGMEMPRHQEITMATGMPIYYRAVELLGLYRRRASRAGSADCPRGSRPKNMRGAHLRRATDDDDLDGVGGEQLIHPCWSDPCRYVYGHRQKSVPSARDRIDVSLAGIP